MEQDTTRGPETPAGEFEAPDPAELREMLEGYAVQELIACGGMGAVYRAEQLSLQREAAIKVLPRELSQFEEFQRSFKAEARAMAQLTHPNLIGVYDFGEVAGMLYLVMEFVDGGSLFEAAHGQVVDPLQAVQIVAGVAAGLGHAHKHDILHRDIKPANILIASDLKPKLGDFGLAVSTGEVASGTVMGTPAYMAPEVLRDFSSATPASDVYGLGVILHELLTGTIPEVEESAVLDRVPNLPDLRHLVRKAIAPSPPMRFEDGGAMAQALETWVEGAGKRTPHVPANAGGFAATPLGPARLPITPQPTPVTIGAGNGAGVTATIGTLTVLLAGILFFIFGRGEDESPPPLAYHDPPLVPPGPDPADPTPNKSETPDSDPEPSGEKETEVLTAASPDPVEIGHSDQPDPVEATATTVPDHDPVPRPDPDIAAPDDAPREDGRFAALRDKFAQAMRERQEAHENAKTRLDGQYLGHLEKLKEQCQRAGDLTAALNVSHEISRFSERSELAKADLVERPATLRKAQETYLTSLEKLTTALDRDTDRTTLRYIPRLEALMTHLTKGGHLDEAAAVRDELHRVRDELVSLGKGPSPPGGVPDDAVSWGGHHYKSFEAEKISFDDAVAACEAAGGHLVYFETREEQEFVVGLDVHRTRWIGGSDKEDEGIFRWLDGTPVPHGLRTVMGGESNMGRDYLHLKSGGLIGCRVQSGYQSNLPHQWVNGYICEWDAGRP